MIKAHTPPDAAGPSLSKCAAALGVSKQYLSKLKRQGRIQPGADGCWSVDGLRAQIEAGRDPGNVVATAVRQQMAEPEVNKAEADATATAATDALGAAQVEALYGTDHRQNLLIARSLRERELAAAARIARMEAEGKLVLLEDVRRESFTIGRTTRDAVMRACMKIAPTLVGIGDAWEMERRLTEAMRGALSEVVQQMEQVA
jgi:hypothetical protein